MKASQLKRTPVLKLSSKERAQNGKMMGTKASGVVISPEDVKKHPEDFKYLNPPKKKPTKKVVVAKKKAKSGGKMGKCKSGCK